MNEHGTSAKIPELLVFVKALLSGFIIAEVGRISSLSGTSLSLAVGSLSPWVIPIGITAGLTIVGYYAISRGLLGAITRVVRSRRIDLLLAVGLGVWATEIALPVSEKFHERITEVGPLWVLFFVSFICLMMVSSLVRATLARRKTFPYPMYFLTDDEIDNEADDVLANKADAIRFAETLLASGSTGGLVYGIDAPWGVGKTSFINLACNYWRSRATNEVIVFRFEPLRYASDPDLPQRLIRDLSSEIQRQVFVPEFRPTANRYSRMLKGKADVSFLGFSLSLEPPAETIDELLEDIDDVLKRIGRRLIVIVDDLDRLDAKAVNDVLFTVRRTFRLKQAVYVLCYDTENLVATHEDAEKARQFLEKFVNIKLSLFVDSSKLCEFLRWDWSIYSDKLQSIPSETMLKLASILTELAEMLEGEHAATYMRMIGDMRKLKRFVNSVLMMQIEKTDFAATDFNRRDVIHLMLLHMNYPGTFRRMYVEETEGRSGIFSILSHRDRDGGGHTYVNHIGFSEYLSSCNLLDKFLLDQIFGVETLDLGDHDSVEESVRASRACFNAKPHRNLELYLKLIVRFASPDPRATFKLYQNTVADVVAGSSIETVLAGSQFDLANGDLAHDEFWRVLVSQSYQFTANIAEGSINTLIQFLPKYSLVDDDNRALRTRSIYNLIRLLDRAGWGRTDGRRLSNANENIVDIAYRIFGENKYANQGLIDQLAAIDRGVLGIYDLMLFRLQCSADRGGQVYNVQGALVAYHNVSAITSGSTSVLAISGMRTLSQRVFSLFRARFIGPRRNLFDEIDLVSDDELLGECAEYLVAKNFTNRSMEEFRRAVAAERSAIKTFIVYQLINRQPGTGSGVGCGYYDANGSADQHEISQVMNEYIFDVCFDPNTNERNVLHFLDYCLSNLTSAFFSRGDDDRYVPTMEGLTQVLDANAIANYWEEFGDNIKARNLIVSDRKVATFNYVATYQLDLPRLIAVLDEIRETHSGGQ